MLKALRHIFDDGDAGLRAKVGGLYAVIIGFTALAWAWALIDFRVNPILLGTAFLAFSFGLRHAVDADHIAAIDNVTRKLMQEGRRPVALGFFFSLGHSLVVILASLAVVLVAPGLKDQLDLFKEWGGFVGTLVSALFLFTIAISNFLIFAATYGKFRRARYRSPVDQDDLDLLFSQRGFVARIFRRAFNIISHGWQMLPLGFLFALGFDTASEIAILGISASEISKNLPIAAIMIFPLLFTAGMVLVDTTDGVLMLGAYGWAFQNPTRKIVYNLSVTLLSVAVALLVCGIEVLGLLSDRLAVKSAFWRVIASLNDSFGAIGYGIVGLFVFGWIVSLAIYKSKGIGQIRRADAKI